MVDVVAEVGAEGVAIIRSPSGFGTLEDGTVIRFQTITILEHYVQKN